MSLVGERISETLMDDLPNMKIEIVNDLDHKMDTEDEGSSTGKAPSESSETEEGEVVDDDDDDRLGLGGKKSSVLAALTVPSGRSILKYDTKEYIEIQQQVAVQNRNGAFVTGINVFSPEEQAKLNKRAQRFGIEASEAKVLTEKLLKKLYKSMCVKPTDKNIRTEALHMRGTHSMTTQDVFNYFKDYGPASLEWITDNSCNVVWLDDISAARALLGLSLHISGQAAPASPQRRASYSDSDVDMETQTQVNKLGPKEPNAVADDSECVSEESDAVPLAEVGTELPPGRWRRGAPHPLSSCVLLRFATTKDRSVPRPGFTKYGSHQFGGYIGLISESRKRRMQNALPNPLIFEDVGDEIIPKPSSNETDNANPWGTLAKTWSQFDRVRQPRPPSPTVERLLPLPTRITPPPSPPDFLTHRPKRVAHRRGRDRRVSDPGENSSGDEEWRKRSKMPRMRMHADDEEEKRDRRMKRVHRNRSQSMSPRRHADLRRKLVVAHREDSDAESVAEPEPVVVEPEEEDDEVPDLRVAVPAERSSSPEDSKTGVRQSLFQTGNVKSVLRGARGHSDNDDEDEDDNEEDNESEDSGKVKSSVRRHRSRSKERRKHHRKHHKESSHHKSRRRDDDSDSEEDTGKMKSTIRKISPEAREKMRAESREKRSSRERRQRGDDDHRRLESSRKSDRRHGESRSNKKDLRSKISHRQKNYDENNEFRSKSPLQIEIDNDEYYKGSESD